jgi:hypothetical protein
MGKVKNGCNQTWKEDVYNWRLYIGSAYHRERDKSALQLGYTFLFPSHLVAKVQRESRFGIRISYDSIISGLTFKSLLPISTA